MSKIDREAFLNPDTIWVRVEVGKGGWNGKEQCPTKRVAFAREIQINTNANVFRDMNCEAEAHYWIKKYFKEMIREYEHGKKIGLK